jgi:hypothetical protein
VPTVAVAVQVLQAATRMVKTVDQVAVQRLMVVLLAVLECRVKATMEALHHQRSTLRVLAVVVLALLAQMVVPQQQAAMVALLQQTTTQVALFRILVAAVAVER